MGWSSEGHLSACFSATPLVHLLAGDAGILMTGSHVTSPHLPRLCHGVIAPALPSIRVEQRSKQDDRFASPG